MYLGQGSSEVKLGGKMEIGLFLMNSLSPITTNLYFLQMQHVGEWVIV